MGYTLSDHYPKHLSFDFDFDRASDNDIDDIVINIAEYLYQLSEAEKKAATMEYIVQLAFTKNPNRVDKKGIAHPYYNRIIEILSKFTVHNDPQEMLSDMKNYIESNGVDKNQQKLSFKKP